MLLGKLIRGLTILYFLKELRQLTIDNGICI